MVFTFYFKISSERAVRYERPPVCRVSKLTRTAKKKTVKIEANTPKNLFNASKNILVSLLDVFVIPETMSFKPKNKL